MRATLSPFYYGWLVLAAAAVSEMLATGASSYASGLFVLPLQAEFHISRAGASSAVLVLFLGTALTAPHVGRLLDRYSLRMVISLGAVTFCAALAGIALAPSLWIMALLLLLPAGAGFAAIGPLSTNTLASRWFFRRRGLALGLAAVATSGGGFVVVPLLSQAIQHLGWRQALLWEALVLVVLIVTVALLVVRDYPATMGLADHRENHGRAEAEARLVAGAGPLSPGTIAKSRAFWLAALTMALVAATSQAMVVTLVPYGIQLGYAARLVAMLIAGFSVCAGITKVVAGLLADRMDLRWLLALAAGLMAFAWLAVALSSAYESLLLSACLGGIALGLALPSSAALIAGSFGAARFGTVMGWAYSLLLVLAIVLVLFAGIVYDRAGGYRPAFVTFAVMLGCLLLAILLLPLPRKDVAA
ncbi:MAG TPA: MFS transporter [Rhizomicrobium sp.]|jgi:MFS family permease|nr:MFS transporter [Rhizomicrobium sp.]